MSEIALIVSARGATAILKRHKVVASESLHTKANSMFKAPQMIAVLWLLNGALVPPAGAQSVARQAGQAQTSGVDASIRPGDAFDGQLPQLYKSSDCQAALLVQQRQAGIACGEDEAERDAASRQ